VILELIRQTTTKTELKREAVRDKHEYETSKQIIDEHMRCVDIQGDTFHPE